MRTRLLLLSIIFLSFFTYFSYIVAKEKYIQIDFDTTVKLQDHIPRRFDEYFSLLSILGSAEVTVGFCVVMAFLSLIKFKILPILGWAMIIPASLAEVFGKLVLYHPAPPVFLHRTLLPTGLPSFYVHTDFSYPSGHMTRTVFIATILLSFAMFQSKDHVQRLVSIIAIVSVIALMFVTRIYLGEHWLSDVIGGTILGIGMGFLASVLILRVKVD
ncbi:hypothetical protein A3J13_00785 [Candidatus Daviesbacteria bacterium RIFCSPLOWO2_02_FULL_36_8]|uniref:Phosphatidic acid phosphatase type 2/haloperoxidase domain-containing protein n=1 Tax=Candidatus Daviesbacteria bacterium RIFCSPLOWO2_02_FULL_36_8 TaxID=1797793 RepID=A0A1F5MH75_9BACT|nr:MAG: hypothetical protein A3J13_00785 [Candidatus Daviesbacteria bacterium RIFCSPLOWO2_02_FULL_36_8]